MFNDSVLRTTECAVAKRVAKNLLGGAGIHNIWGVKQKSAWLPMRFFVVYASRLARKIFTYCLS
jgi:hypothetical protein